MEIFCIFYEYRKYYDFYRKPLLTLILQKTTINVDKFIMWHLVLWQSEA